MDIEDATFAPGLGVLGMRPSGALRGRYKMVCSAVHVYLVLYLSFNFFFSVLYIHSLFTWCLVHSDIQSSITLSTENYYYTIPQKHFYYAISYS